MNLARSSTKLFLANLSNAGLQFLGITVFARELGASQLGTFFLFQALLGILAIPVDFGLRGAVEKRISEGEAPGIFLSSAIILKLIPITVIVLGILLLHPFINGYFGAELAVFLALAIILQEAAQLSVAVLKGQFRVGETAVLNLTRQIIWVGGGIILVNYGYGVNALIYSLLAGLCMILAWGWYKSSIPLKRPSTTHAYSLANYGKYNVVSSIGGYFYSWMDVAIIGLFLTQTEVGAYEIAWRVTAVSILFSQAIATTIFPQVSNWNADGIQDRIENLISSAITPSLFFVVPAFFGAVLLSQEILGLVFGEEYTIAALVLVVLMADKVFQAIQLIVAKSLQAIDKPDLAARATVVSVISNAILNVILVLKFGILGAAFATLISSLLNDLLHLIYLRRFIRISFPYREVAECVFASLGMIGGLHLLGTASEVDSLSRLIAFIILGVAIYGLLSLMLPNLRRRIISVIERIRVT